jgi:hypothetical protein
MTREERDELLLIESLVQQLHHEIGERRRHLLSEIEERVVYLLEED